MKSTIHIDFQKIAGSRVNEELITKNPNLPKKTKKTLNELCKQIERFFKDYKIDVKASFKLE